jgi:hypothetical protein
MAAPTDSAERRVAWRLGIGAALVLAYVLPLFVPPPALPYVPVTDASTLLERVFPGVPAWWTAGRLLALLLGAALLASAVAAPATRGLLPPEDAPLAPVPGTSACRVALLASGLHVAAVPWVARLSEVGQLVYLCWLGVPALVLAAGTRRVPATGTRARAGRLPLGVLLVVAVWAVTRLAVSWHAPRAANGVDMWRNIATMQRLVEEGGNVLVGGIGPGLPGTNSVSFVMQGLPILRALDLTPTFGWLQVANVFWLATAGVCVGALAALMIGPEAAAVATAVLLFSPFLLSSPLATIPIFDGPVFTAVPLLLLVCFLRSGSAVTLALLGPAAGLATTRPALVPFVGIVLLVAAWNLWTRPRLPRTVVAAAGLSLLAAVLPSAPGPQTLRAMASVYVATQGQYEILEETVMGQRPTTSGARAGWLDTRPPGPLDVPVGALLSPFAAARSALRLYGDVAYDPVGAALAGVGLLLSLRFAAGNGGAALLPALLLAALLTGFVSSGDRPSLMRTYGAMVPLALLAAAGLAGVRSAVRHPRARRLLAPLAVAAIVAGGSVLFDVVNPRILRWSSLALMADAVDEPDLVRTVLVHDMRTFATWLQLGEIATHVPARPVPVVTLGDLTGAEGAPAAGAPRHDVLFWSPATEEIAGMAGLVCARWPAATLFAVTDPAGLSRVHAAHVAGAPWRPALPAAQWRPAACAQAS